MQIYNNTQIPNTTTPNFKAIKSVKCEGLYKKFPEYGKELIDTFKNNEPAMDFCKKYDVNIVFNAIKQSLDDTTSSILIFFDNPAKKKVLGMFGSKKDKIQLSTYSNRYNVKKSLSESTNLLKDYITDFNRLSKSTTGVLNSHIKIKEQEINEALAINNKAIGKQAKKIDNTNTKTRTLYNKSELDKSIEDLINSSK